MSLTTTDITQTPGPAETAPSGKTLTRDAKPVVILIVDDDDDCRLLMRDAIDECRVTNDVFEASSGEAALAFCADDNQPTPGLIFLDIEMPGIDGLETLRRLRENPALRDVSIVMMTGVCGEEQMQQAARSGANSYTCKPASGDEFLQTVLTSTRYWLTIHQYPTHHWAPETCRR